MKIMGMDIGEKRIGIAITDDKKKLSMPYCILENNSDFADKLSGILEKENIEKIIVGMPYTLKGEIGGQGKMILDFVRDNMLYMGIEVIYQDERFTSKLITFPDKKKENTGKYKDKYSAALILQGYLDRSSAIKRIKE